MAPIRPIDYSQLLPPHQQNQRPIANLNVTAVSSSPGRPPEAPNLSPEEIEQTREQIREEVLEWLFKDRRDHLKEKLLPMMVREVRRRERQPRGDGVEFEEVDQQGRRVRMDPWPTKGPWGGGTWCIFAGEACGVVVDLYSDPGRFEVWEDGERVAVSHTGRRDCGRAVPPPDRAFEYHIMGPRQTGRIIGPARVWLLQRRGYEVEADRLVSDEGAGSAEDEFNKQLMGEIERQESMDLDRLVEDLLGIYQASGWAVTPEWFTRWALERLKV